MDHVSQIMQNRRSSILDDMNSYKAAVLLPLIEHQGKPSILFEVRSERLEGQPGEICFPGGHMEKQDPTPQETAVRETVEELGVQYTDINILGPLDILVQPSNMIIYPYVGQIKSSANLKPQEDEVAEVFYVPLDYLRQVEPTVSYTKLEISPSPDFPHHLIPNGKDYNWHHGLYPVYFYCYEKYIIWGLTARILCHFLTLTS